MIHCPDCDIQFSPKHPVCPRCREFATPEPERKAFLSRNAADRVSAGADPDLVRDELVRTGFSHFEADEIVGVAARRLRLETRGYGLRRLVGGIATLVFAGVVLLLFLGGLWFKAVIVLFLLSLGAGLGLTFSGLYSLVTGRGS